MTPAKTRSVPPDRVIANVSDRRPALLDVIREAKREITLSLFRCNDAEIFAELTRAVAREELGLMRDGEVLFIVRDQTTPAK